MTHHGPKTLEHIARLARSRIRDESNVQQFRLGIFGPPGTGKSGLALLMADDIDEGRFEPADQVAVAKGDFDVVRRKVGPGRPIIDDEASNSGGLKKRAMSTVNVDRLVDSNTNRKKRHAIFSLMPFMDDYDESLFRHLDWVLKLTSQGEGIAFEVQRRGLKKTHVWLSNRFTFDFPDCAAVRPDLWERYDALFSRGEAAPGRAAREERVSRFRSILRRVLREP